MLKMWMFIMMINGQPLQVLPSDSETHCRQIMIKRLVAQQALGHAASGACFVRATIIGDTEEIQVIDPAPSR